MQTLKDFFSQMLQSVPTKRTLVQEYITTSKFSQDYILQLKSLFSALNALPKNDEDKFILYLDEEKKEQLVIDLSYELKELKQDLLFMNYGFAALWASFQQKHLGYFDKEVIELKEFLHGKRFRNFITDRDGTINNYCARYVTSVQSVYNALLLTFFINAAAQNSIILTSAPLQNTGLMELSILPDKTFVYAASKGREFIDLQGKYFD